MIKRTIICDLCHKEIVGEVREKFIVIDGADTLVSIRLQYQNRAGCLQESDSHLCNDCLYPIVMKMLGRKV